MSELDNPSNNLDDNPDDNLDDNLDNTWDNTWSEQQAAYDYYYNSPFDRDLVRRRVCFIIGQVLVDSFYTDEYFAHNPGANNNSIRETDWSGIERGGKTWLQHMSEILGDSITILNPDDDSIDNQEHVLNELLIQTETRDKVKVYREITDIINRDTIERYLKLLNLKVQIEHL